MTFDAICRLDGGSPSVDQPAKPADLMGSGEGLEVVLES